MMFYTYHVETNGVVRSVLNPDCGSRQLLALIGDRWTVCVIYVLGRGTLRFGQLQREIGISQKVLTETLRRLERNGMVQRTVYAVIPPRVDYALTELGRSLHAPLCALCCWSEQHLDEVEAAQASYTQEHGTSTPPIEPIQQRRRVGAT